MVKIKLFEMFAGYGGASFALKKAKIPFECVGYSEIDKFAIKCYKQNHCEFITTYGGGAGWQPSNYGDATIINPHSIEDFDLLTGGFPCKDVSIAGRRDLKRGQTILFDEIIRIAEVKKPKYMLLENVEGLLSMHSFWVYVKSELSRIGYNYRYKVLRSCDYGIPQLRPRVWIICQREMFKPFKQIFPEKEKLKLYVKDILEEDVDRKYYLTESNIKSLLNAIKRRDKNIIRLIDPIISTTLTCKDPKSNFSESIIIHNLQPRTSKTGKGGTGHLCRDGVVSYTIDCGNNKCIQINDDYRVFTPTECFRLMGFVNYEINLDGLSDTQKYKLAGNGWDINVVSKIFKTWFKNTKYLNK